MNKNKYKQGEIYWHITLKRVVTVIEDDEKYGQVIVRCHSIRQCWAATKSLLAPLQTELEL